MSSTPPPRVPAPPDVQLIFAQAVWHHQASRLGEAEGFYRQVVALDARHADSLHLLGVIALQTGRAPLATDVIGEAIAVQPGNPSYHSNLGLAYGAVGRLDEAMACFRRALDLNPDYPEAYSNLAAALNERGRLDEAMVCLQKALALKPDYPQAHNNLGNTYQLLGRLDEAVDSYQAALDLAPDYAEARANLGVAMRGGVDPAVADHRRRVDANPTDAVVHNNLGGAFHAQGRMEQAVVSYRQAIALNSNYFEAYGNLGAALHRLGELDEAVACYHRAIALKPDYLDAYSNLGLALLMQGRVDDAIVRCCAAIDIKPDFASAHGNLSLALLARGDLEPGWKEYEWRWKTASMKKDLRTFPQPQWRGEAGQGRILLIYAEQGFGDTLQFCRYAQMAAARGFRVILQVQKPLVSLLSDLPGVEQVVDAAEPSPAFDLHCPMLSLPLAFGTTLATIPSGAAYVRADPVKTETWGARLDAAIGANAGLKVGLAWAGNASQQVDRRRSIAPDRLKPLFDVPGVQMVSLQKGGPSAPRSFPMIDVMSQMEDFADTAALVANLDLVIAVDTSIAHLGAAMGKPVWLLNRYDSCWRWLMHRRDSPWYPSVRIYRQPRPDDWDSVLVEMVQDLRGLAAENPLVTAP